MADREQDKITEPETGETNKRPRWESEDWRLDLPDAEKVPCKDCYNRAKDRDFGGGAGIKGAILAVCEVYTSKPEAILWKYEECPYYVSEKDVEGIED